MFCQRLLWRPGDVQLRGAGLHTKKKALSVRKTSSEINNVTTVLKIPVGN